MKKPVAPNVRQVTVPAHPHPLVVHAEEIDVTAVSDKIAASAAPNAEAKPVYSIFDKAAWSGKKKKADETAPAPADSFPALKPGGTLPHNLLVTESLLTFTALFRLVSQSPYPSSS